MFKAIWRHVCSKQFEDINVQNNLKTQTFNVSFDESWTRWCWIRVFLIQTSRASWLITPKPIGTSCELHMVVGIALNPCSISNKHVISTRFNLWTNTQTVATLALGFGPRQGLARVRTKSEAQKSHFVLPGGWECRRVWKNEHSHSQVSSHFGSWSPLRVGVPKLPRWYMLPFYYWNLCVTKS
jgi:hypothetical protein